MLSAKQAGEATGVSKQAIIRAIKRGTISASKDVHGEWTIDASELFRVYQPVPLVHSNEGVHDELVHPSAPSVDTLLDKVTMLERIIRDKDDVIGDLRQRLDRASDEQEKLGARLLALTTPAPVAPKGFWQRLLGA